MNYRSARRRRYEALAWKNQPRTGKAVVHGTKHVAVYFRNEGMTVLAPIHQITNKQLLRLIPHGIIVRRKYSGHSRTR
jgi:hypothetical protein